MNRVLENAADGTDSSDNILGFRRSLLSSPVVKPEVSRVYGWPDIPENGGGDIELANYQNGK